MNKVTIDITILAPVEKVWDYFNDPKHIVKWNFAHESWYCPSSENDLKVGGKFNNRMEAKDGSFGFDFTGIYDEVDKNERIKYHIEDGREVEVIFEKIDENTTKVTQIFDPEKQNSVEMQREGWYAILNNFHKYVENH
ncbi:SRPBCC family protein [Chryseobacterium sp. Ch-15]|uniref:SRPBCC family protein n=1 Tax=Chryseobacterium muglaense TaxID=2893752 RepID=A0A9Q3YR40_9FLAO|nr:SRPBCC family protein [Chryseobacterium muglaense]MBD3906912.1 SRPBCC family protein [Chryseobacterium muglaense]MCC9033758.1 SRPBCC family protein [Chryseobacterium muglaense]MCM2556682.1 SRPBCC family protein [Chryseobacterium muglaense]